ncbi:hypothetical protein GTY87_20385 [Streptomyces sp. SID7813]|uniref:Uncharacterized protein n=1 Tax=Streptomyces coelicolor (strain ATCC BAA-471 / A3(2) / M145) TaxID=100226 RepID=Q93J16_STRCO|nr:hypothetical protein [Streptomyces sp. SID7813]QFI43984.1 hypothetical protein FQ762_20565 [Streptomyces coelicolor A3(2)]CAC44716.1 hypothetical protein [Streptomyces coelicolor A3(2)]
MESIARRPCAHRPKVCYLFRQLRCCFRKWTFRSYERVESLEGGCCKPWKKQEQVSLGSARALQLAEIVSPLRLAQPTAYPVGKGVSRVGDKAARLL